MKQAEVSVDKSSSDSSIDGQHKPSLKKDSHEFKQQNSAFAVFSLDGNSKPISSESGQVASDVLRKYLRRLKDQQQNNLLKIIAAEQALTKANFTVEMLQSYHQILTDSFEKRFETKPSHFNLLHLIEGVMNALKPVAEQA